MNQGKWTLGLFMVIPLIGIVSLTNINRVSAQTVTQEDQRSTDDRLLEQRVLALPEVEVKNQTLVKFSLSDSVARLRNFSLKAEPKTPKCVDAKKIVFADKYVMSFDEQSKPCRIYDLSFPNIQALFTRKKVTQIPVRNLASKDYLNWLDGNMDAVNQSHETYKNYFDPKLAAKNSWVSKLKFRIKPEAVLGSKNFETDLGLPISFSLADLDIGSDFSFDLKTRTQVQEYASQLKKTETMSGTSESEGFASDYLLKVMNKPEILLRGVRFSWNDLEKVYDVIWEADFFPIKGPVALVNYQTQYKYAVEKMFRSFLSSGLVQLTSFIPNKLISSAVEVLITDAFEQMEAVYDYQMLQLEEALKSLSQDPNSAMAEQIRPHLALNLLYGQRSDLFSAYIMSVAQQKDFDWQAFDKLGKAARYSVDKQREVTKGQMNSRLVLEKKCDIEFFQEYFAICSKNGTKWGLYSLISNQPLAMKSLGAPLIYKYQKPYDVGLIRAGTWMLSAALRIVGLPLSRFVTYKLDSVLKNFMKAGILDEALLKSNLTAKKQAGVLANENIGLLNTLFFQNLNPFLPKTLTAENNLITINKQLLGIGEEQ